MPELYLLSVIFAVGIVGVWFSMQRRARLRRKRHEESSIWGELAAGIFDGDDCPLHARLEIVLSAISRKLGLRAGMVTVRGRSTCRVIAASSAERALIEGLNPGTSLRLSSLFCEKLREPGKSLAIDYASLSEWRRHPALLERGWESYIAVHCGMEQAEDVVVAFFDTSPRPGCFTRAEISLVEQLVPWITASLGALEARKSSENAVPATNQHP